MSFHGGLLATFIVVYFFCKKNKVDFFKLADQLFHFECGLDAVGLKPVFRLSPPRKGYRHIKRPFPRGALGYRSAGMSELLKRMI